MDSPGISGMAGECRFIFRFNGKGFWFHYLKERHVWSQIVCSTSSFACFSDAGSATATPTTTATATATACATPTPTTPTPTNTIPIIIIGITIVATTTAATADGTATFS